VQRYFLNQVHRGECIIDDEGECFPDLEAVKNEVIVSAREIMAERLRNGDDLNHSRFEVQDERGQVVLVLPFSEAIPDMQS
jgi:hypothetical protein